MRIVVDANVPEAQRCFGALGQVVSVPGREIDAATVRDADALVVRSVTRVDEALVADSRLRFVGTCTIGTDHVDDRALSERGIGFASAPGCNAEAVVDYVLASLATLAERGGFRLTERRVGIVGVGNVGGRLLARLKALGIDCLACDPPRAEEEGGTGFVDLDTLIDDCDVLCLHTPLVEDGPHATRHLLDARRIAELTPGTLVLNAGRGDCVDGRALRSRLSGQGDIPAVLDVWENEPAIDAALRDQSALATPHVAGYSLDGKLRGTHQVYRALARHVGLPARLGEADLMPAPPVPRLVLDGGLEMEEALRLCMRAVYDPRRDHDALEHLARTRGMAKGFDACRAGYPLRREFSTLEVVLEDAAADLAEPLSAAGFRVG
ncbi:4-phosphoerythronate dehydrogenase PdxB [Halomonas elongata]|uniref:Erythronate-4-phosphate dehydrogenase n=1 Tax=Halomonas elongata (strain ATCC 33173 / DSM 2581 / NBRC 15536 / NCIMB 2198 / 1H9) TaxID=768066 RepID=E1V9R1_HALED|nr:4-phosphoerythronate dehydrogenase PdxB [Halomonas elongata]WBF19138.1 4-phosphoerythronate dehydrogenase PdxB [Halomonas elongata]WPU47997.1 4-phosphoerythronate dehydrogenase PdxB [Halomonas elongata DSM 2581]CBV41895.1 erythronate-4-phosphate dehydrogenase [Halomonas elongata DSM 2581]